jgi:hypothetical protein
VAAQAPAVVAPARQTQPPRALAACERSAALPRKHATMSKRAAEDLPVDNPSSSKVPKLDPAAANAAEVSCLTRSALRRPPLLQ